jgi:Predicted acyl-CoA transferases/carnitine dehydratase
MIGKPELADDPRFKTNAERVKNNDLIVGPPAGGSRQAQHR